jgi:hypothetical protein
MLQEQNSCSFNSQKENMMQAANLATSNVKNSVKTQAAAKLASEPKADKAKQTEVVEVSKPPSFSRTLEAYSDCV